VFDHLERPMRPLERRDHVVADLPRRRRATQPARLVGIPLDGIGRGGDRLGDRLRADLPATHGIDLGRGTTQRGVRARGEIADLLLEPLQLARAGDDPSRAAKDHDERGGDGDEGRDREQEPKDQVRAQPSLRSARLGVQALEERIADLEQVALHEEVGELGDGRIGVAVHGNDRARRPHPDLVLDRAADA